MAAEIVISGTGGACGFAIRPPDLDRLLPSWTPVYLGRIGGEMRRADRAPDESAIASLAARVLADIGDPFPGPLIGVCTNGRRDRCENVSTGNGGHP